MVSLTEDSTVRGAAVSVSDPRADDQYYLTDVAFEATGACNTLNAMLKNKGLTEAESSPVRVAVIDTGVDGSHADLVNRVTDGYDAVNDVALSAGINSDISTESHGTMVAGLIAAEANNDIGIAGLSYTLPVSIVPVRALDSSAKGKLSDIVSAIYWAVDEGDADILNLSFGIRMKSRPAALETAVHHAVDEDVMVIASAGNEGRTVTYDNYNYYPAALEGVMAVGSITQSRKYGSFGYTTYFSSFTNKVMDKSYLGKSFFYVPGEELLTTAQNDGYASFTGTSASAAVFSGMMASLLSVSRATDGVDPRNNVYTLYGNPSTLTVTASTDTLAQVQDAPLAVLLPNGAALELAVIEGGSTEVSLSTDLPLTFTVTGNTLTLQDTFSSADGDVEWNLDEALAAAVTLTVDSPFADATEVRLNVGDRSFKLPKEGGAVHLLPGEYDVSALVCCAGEYSSLNYYEVDFGKLQLTDNRTLTLGSEVSAELTLGSDDIAQNQEMSVRFQLSDSEGNPITDLGTLYDYGSGDVSRSSAIEGIGVRIGRYREDDEAWEDLDTQFINWSGKDGTFTSRFSTSLLDNEVGSYRLRLHSYDSWPFDFDGDWRAFKVHAEESRPAALVKLRLLDYGGSSSSADAGFRVLLKDEDGEWIVREAMMSSDTWNPEFYTYLPIGGTYRAAVVGTQYYEPMGATCAVASVFDIDLTDAAAGDTVEADVQPDDTWSVTEFVNPNGASAGGGVSVSPIDGGDSLPIGVPIGVVDDSDMEVSPGGSGAANIVGVTVYPFAELPRWV